MSNVVGARFTLRTLLLATAIAAAWCGTFALGSLGADLRKLLQFAILIAAAASTLHYRQERRAFWSGFLAGYLLLGTTWLRDAFDPLVPHLRWASALAKHYAATPDGIEPGPLYYSLSNTTWLASVLLLSCLSGYISLTIYRQACR